MKVESKPVKYNKYIVLKKTSQGLPKGHWTYIALIDRNKSKNHWWTVNKENAMVFNLKSAAQDKAKSLKYGPCKAVPLSKFCKFVGMEFWNSYTPTSALRKEITDHEAIWHDDDWYEGMNDD